MNKTLSRDTFANSIRSLKSSVQYCCTLRPSTLPRSPPNIHCLPGLLKTNGWNERKMFLKTFLKQICRVFFYIKVQNRKMRLCFKSFVMELKEYSAEELINNKYMLLKYNIHLQTKYCFFNQIVKFIVHFFIVI